MNKRRIVISIFALALLGVFGIGQEKQELNLTLEDSIVRALRNNLNVAAEVINPGLASANLSLALQMYTPTLQIDLSGNRYERASSGPFQATDTFINKATSTTTSIAQQIPFGGNLTASLSYDYSKSNQLFQSFNPSSSSRLNFVLTSPCSRTSA
ncbi:MAG: hypothetical protein HGA24_09755, partial [Candidatus Aminicenantes bacterium]|nr:hypothetical protein [Candidatus Aminicenantes bacterium]